MSDTSSRALPPTVRGRGTPENPGNRFERLHIDLDLAERDPEDPAPRTQFYRDDTRRIIAYNDSPDIGYRASVNPYRGCEHGCAYCLSGDTAILMADGSTKALRELRVGDAVYGTVRQGWYRRYITTEVLAHWRTHKPAYRITLEDGTTLVASADHRFLTERGWKFVLASEQGQRPHLTRNNKLMGVGAFATLPNHDREYRRGYLCGVIRGDGLLASYHYERQGRSHGDQHQFRLALADDEALDRTREYLCSFGVPTFQHPFQAAARRPMQALRTHAKAQVERIRDLVSWPLSPSGEWLKGFLAGLFDAEGSCSLGTWRLSNTDAAILAAAKQALAQLGFRIVVEAPERTSGKALQVLRLHGGLAEQLRFFHTTDPAIRRKCDLEGRVIKSSAKLRLASVEPLGLTLPLYDITTGTGDFIANGVVSHNCYARPTHEYLGFSAGLDFETKIMVKTAAPELLRAELSEPGWQPQVLGLSGVTDCYQPVEKRLELTRRCLEVLAEFRNPVAIVTKSHLVTRDLDVLEELAKYDAVSVAVSLTTLDESLRRMLEPRAATALRRLDAVARLREAGIHVGVLTCPIIPGLTDHEIPALVKAAVAAGASFAGYNIVHLPYGLKEIFAEWLGRHLPERKARVLNRIREVRGGRLNDPRFGYRMTGEGLYAEQLRALHRAARRQAGLEPSSFRLLSEHFRVPGRAVQGRLFD